MPSMSGNTSSRRHYENFLLFFRKIWFYTFNANRPLRDDLPEITNLIF